MIRPDNFSETNYFAIETAESGGQFKSEMFDFVKIL